MRHVRYTFSFFVAVFTVLFFLFPPVAFSRHTDELYPKRANFFLSLTLTEQDAIALSRWDLVVLNLEQQELNPELISLMRRRNPHIRIFPYVGSNSIVQNLGQMRDIHPILYRFSLGIDSRWYVRSQNGEKLSWWPNTSLLNVSNRAPRVNGIRFNEYLANFVTNDVLASGLWDGVFIDNTWDNITHFAGSDIDLNLDGFIDRDSNSAWREGMETLLQLIREKNSQEHLLLVGNNDTRAYTQELNGMLLENFSGERWVHQMNRYAFNNTERRNTHINIINTNTANTGQRNDYKKMRFGLTSTLLENGYYSFDFGDQNHGQTWWYDEYDARLGAPEGASTSSMGVQKYDRAVWQRPFDQGLVIVNSTREKKNIVLDTDYEKIRGTQDTKINDGSIVREVNVDGEDGIVLMKLISKLDGISYTNGAFARPLRADGSRMRNGFFLFEQERLRGDRILRADIDRDLQNDLIVGSGPRLFVWRSDGLLYMRKYPYGPSYSGTLHIVTADITGDGFAEIIVAPSTGYAEPVKIYTRHGQLVGQPWYPFGRQYNTGISVAIGDVDPYPGEEFVIGSVRSRPQVSVYSNTFTQIRSWHPFARQVRGLPSVAIGDVLSKNTIIVGAGPGSKPLINMFSGDGKKQGDTIVAYQSFGLPGVEVGAYDADFDGTEDIVALSQGVGL